MEATWDAAFFELSRSYKMQLFITLALSVSFKKQLLCLLNDLYLCVILNDMSYNENNVIKYID